MTVLLKREVRVILSEFSYLFFGCESILKYTPKPSMLKLLVFCDITECYYYTYNDCRRTKRKRTRKRRMRQRTAFSPKSYAEGGGGGGGG